VSFLTAQKDATTKTQQRRPPFHITKEEERKLCIEADHLNPSLVLAQTTSLMSTFATDGASNRHGSGPQSLWHPSWKSGQHSTTHLSTHMAAPLASFTAWPVRLT
jgi:hypothetical protein